MLEFSELLSLAQKSGLANIAVISTDQLTFKPEYLAYCEENRCGNYNRNYACPPHCGTPAEMEQKVKQYKYALVMQSLWECDDFSNETLLKQQKAQHISYMNAFLEAAIPEHEENLVISAGCCSYCNPCAIVEGAPCRFPQKRRSCLSAYCIDAASMAEAAGMICWHPDGKTVAYFGVYLYN